MPLTFLIIISQCTQCRLRAKKKYLLQLDNQLSESQTNSSRIFHSLEQLETFVAVVATMHIKLYCTKNSPSYI